MLIFALLVFAGDSPARGSLCQADMVEGRSTLHYRPLNLASDRSETPLSGQAVPEGSWLTRWKVGSAAGQSYAIVWNTETKAIWIDLDRDGAFSPGEKWTLGSKPVAIPLSIDGRSRVGLVRLRGGEPLIAVRGYIESQIRVEGNPYKAYLLDGDADGCFHRVGIDRFWLDVNGDGRIDPLVETFLMGLAIDIGGARYLFKASGTGEKIEVFRRPKNDGNVRFDLVQGAKFRPKELVLNLASVWGEWVQLRQIDQLQTLPVGRYRVVDLEFQLEDGDREAWSYRFLSTETKFDLEIRENEKIAYELLPHLKLHFQVESLAEGKGAMVRPWIASSNGLSMSCCDKGMANFLGGEKEKSTYTWTEEKAVIRLNDAGSRKLDEQKTCFTCYAIRPFPVRAPANWEGESLEVTVTMPTGPLLGDLFEYKSFKLSKKK